MCPEFQVPAKGLRVTACRTEDLSRVEALLQDAPEAAAWSASGLAATLEHYPDCFLLAWQYEEMAGFIAGRRVADEGEILNLAVEPQCRRRGVGKALVEALLEVLSLQSVVEVFLEVRESNAAASSFYESLGFRPSGKRPGYYRNPAEAALLLRLRLSSPAGEGDPTASTRKIHKSGTD